MDFNIIQILLVAVFAFIAGIDQFSFLESLYQPIVSGAVIGAILGDLQTGLVVGGTYQLMTIGNMPVGGAQPPNAVIGGIMAVIGGIMAVVFAVSSKLEPAAAVGLAVPFALIGQYFVTFVFTIMAPLMSKADKYAEEANPSGIVKLNFLAMGALGLSFAVIVVIGLIGGAAAGETLTALSNQFKWFMDGLSAAWFMDGLSAAGGMMRYVGFAILLRIMLSKELWGIYFAGFALATIVGSIESLSGSALLIIAFIGIAVAVYDFQNNVKLGSQCQS